MLHALADHLWQSTLFGGAATLAVLVLRGAPARLRHRVWLIASLKFLLPFAALTAIGEEFGWTAPVPVTQRVGAFVETFGQPFSLFADVVQVSIASGRIDMAASAPVLSWTAVIAALWLAGALVLGVRWTLAWLQIRRRVRTSDRCDEGRELQLLTIAAAATGTPAVPLHFVDASIEPGVFGIWRPVLLWPRSIGERLTDAQVSAIFAHELAHVRRRDNLTAGVSMLVRAIFWFHPLVAWIETRLMAERERACDEEVVRSGSEPQAYAEGLLRTCDFYLESPLICVAGVTGADLKRRVAAIMRSRAVPPPAAWQRALVVALAVGTIAGPLAMGLFAAPQSPVILSAPAPGITPVDDAAFADARFEVASVKKSTEDDARGFSLLFQPGGRFGATNVTLRMLITAAYGNRVPLQRFQLTGGPAWLDTDRFTITAKAEADLRPDAGGPPPAMFAMLRNLLADRFALQMRRETREADVYALVLARRDGQLGPSLERSSVDCAALVAANGGRMPPVAPGSMPPCGARIAPGKLIARSMRIADLGQRELSRVTGRMVLDRTGLQGLFDINLEWTPEQSVVQSPDAPAVRPLDSDVSIYTALQEQLGLRLEPARAPVDYFVIERAEQPGPD